MAGTWALLLCPLIAFVVMTNVDGLDPRLQAPTQHFWIVSAATLVSGGIAAALVLSVESVRTTRNVFLALGFMSIALIFAAHGLSTPGFIIPADQEPYGVRVSAGLSQLAGATFIFLSVLPEWSPAGRAVQASARWLMPAAFVALLGYLALIMGRPGLFSFIPDSQTWDAGLAISTVTLLAVAAWRYWRAWRLTGFPGQFAMVVALVLLAETQVSLYYGTLWQTSWWLYHFLMLAAFLTLVSGWAIEAKRAGSLLLFARAIALRDGLDRVKLADPATLDALEHAMGARDDYTRHHMGRVADFAVAIGREMRLGRDSLEVIEVAGRIHDIGKIAVPDAILMKPGKLTPDEYDQMKMHSAQGEQIARASKVLAHAAAVVRAHHERYDGNGYPDRLAGDRVPLEARIIAVADTFDALTTPRVYRDPWTFDAAVLELKRVAGTQLDPRCVAAFLRWLEREALIAPEVAAVA
ncbi:MAG: HD-GYP domain-containing protein [Tepidiformaceae bacterium]